MMSKAGHREARFPDVLVTTHEGRRARFYTDLVAGKSVILHFMYTNCGGSCPRTTANMAKVRDRLGSRVGRDVFIYSISVDPAHDTPAKLREYANRFHVSPGWLFLTGRPSDIAALRKAVGDDPAKATAGSNHLDLVIYGVEPLQRWGACPALAGASWIARYLSWLDPKGERPDGSWPSARHADIGS
jgi:protein SCO1